MFPGDKYRKRSCREEEETFESQIHWSHLAVAPQILRENSAFRVPDHLLLAPLRLAPALMYVSFSLCLIHAWVRPLRRVSTGRCPWSAAYSSSSTASLASRRNSKSNAGLGARGGREVVRHLDECFSAYGTRTDWTQTACTLSQSSLSYTQHVRRKCIS